MIGVTVSTPKYAALSREAVVRFKRGTGLDVLVLKARDGEDAFLKKLRLELECPAVPCVSFDADWWLLRELDLSGLGTGWCAVHDAGVFHPAAFCKSDCERLELDKGSYFNSGFFSWDNGNAQHRQVFEIARTAEHAQFCGKADALDDWGDQSLLNLGVQRAGVPLALLPFGFNCMMHFVRGGVFPFVPRVVHAVHAAGVPLSHKMAHLKSMAQVFSYEPEPLQPEAVAFHHALSFDTR